MNIRKFSIVTVSLLLAAASSFAWSKKSENMGNLGRMNIALGGGVTINKYKDSGESVSPTGAAGRVEINAPVFRPGVNTFRNISWMGVDAGAFFSYDYLGKFDLNAKSYSGNSFSTGVSVTPYLNFETGLPLVKALKPFAMAYAGYRWESGDSDTTSYSKDYFIYGVGAGVEVVLLDELSVTPFWRWNGNQGEQVPCSNVGGIDISYWFSDQFCFAIYWEHYFASDRTADIGLNLSHGDLFGAKIKIGFLR